MFRGCFFSRNAAPCTHPVFSRSTAFSWHELMTTSITHGLLGCTHIQNCLRLSCNRRIAQREEIHGANHFHLVKIQLSSVFSGPKTFINNSLTFFFKLKEIEEINGKFLALKKMKQTNFDLVKAVLPIKPISLGCSPVTRQSETVLYMSTPEPHAFKKVFQFLFF